MNKAEIHALLVDTVSWRKATNIERMKFARIMRGKQYGFDALEIAFAFWIHGYRTGGNEL